MNRFWKIKFNAVNLAKLIPSTVYQRFISPSNQTHILFCMVDHFEPGTGDVSPDVERERMRELCCKFPLLCAKHADSHGHPPKRTWFFPPHYHRNDNLKKLVDLCLNGYGEIELHLHHGKTKRDTSEHLRETINRCLLEYADFGIFGTQNGQKRYGFIHGNSALDNSRKNKYCGVNNEIDILLETGCYADFTFPCACEANPSKINSIYYAVDDPLKPKSYNCGANVVLNGNTGENGLMIIQGPLFPYFKRKGIFGLRLYTPVIDGLPPVDKKRIDAWIRSNIHIKGSENWIIIKTHTHGAVESDAVLGNEMDFILSYLESRYNDGDSFILHYVTARELYNIIKAIEAGEPLTTPENYRDYQIQPPNYVTSSDISEASEYLRNLVAETYR